VSGYPKRPPHFAHKFCRLLTKSAAALQIGPEVCWLLTLIVHQEDAKRYRGPANYWNHQLMGVLGVSSVGRLDRVRSSAVSSGWLHYEAGGKGKVGTYWVMIPKHADGLEDGASDESEEDLSIHLQSQNATTNGQTTVREPGDKQETTVREPVHKPSTSNPIPNPNPNTHTSGVESVAFEVAPGVDVDWLQVESAFMARWNGTDGTIVYSRTNIPQNLVREFQDRYLTPGWIDRAHAALAKFPLPSGNKLTLATFLRDGKVDELLGGSNDWTPGSARHGPGRGGGQRPTSGEHNRDSAAKALEILNAARRRNEDGKAGRVPRLTRDPDGAGGDADVD
jgi:hypothetical protein